MKKLLFIFTTLLAFYIVPAQYCGNSSPSVCTASGTLSQPGFTGSDSIQPFINAQSSNTVIQFKNYTTIVFSGSTVTIDSLTIDSISNLPFGLCWASDQYSNTYQNGQSGCIGISGTTCATPGQYKLNMVFTVVFSGISVVVNADAVGLKLYLRVNNQGEATVAVDTSQSSSNPVIAYGPASSCVTALSVSLGGGTAVCDSSLTTYAANVSGGQGPYTYHWSSSADPLSCDTCSYAYSLNTVASTYKVTVTDFLGATATDSLVSTILASGNNSHFTLTNSFINCAHPIDTITVVVTNVTTPYFVNWGDGNGTSLETTAGTYVYTYSQPGYYSVVVQDSIYGCSTHYFTAVIQNLGINDSFFQIHSASCAGSPTGSIVPNINGGTPPYTYRWNNSATTDSISGLWPGVYSLTVTDASSCSAVFRYNLGSTGNGPQAYIYASYTNCTSSDSLSCYVYGGTQPYSFLWNDSSTTQILQNVPSGIYSVTITDANGCTTIAGDSLFTTCYSYITGNIFGDPNGNCVLDSGETEAAGITVVADLGGQLYYGYTDYYGNYTIGVPTTGTYLVYTGQSSGTCITTSTMCGNPSQNVTISTLGSTSANNNFALQGPAGFDLGIHPGWTPSSPGSSKRYWMYYYNSSGSYTGTVTLTFQYDPNLTFVSSDIPYTTYDATNHIFTWVINNFNNGAWDYIGSIYFNVPSSLSNTYQLQSDFRIDPTAGDCDTSDNHYHFSEIVSGSHDPNEKTVEPAGNITADDSVLTYTIHFQNTGTAATSFIVVKDTLSANLDAATVRNIASSHTYSHFAISGAGVLTWTFDPISLPDSSTNRNGSMGFVTFTVKQKKNLPVGTTISNRASVYFDYNQPVVTNTVNDTMTTNTVTGLNEVKTSNGVTVRVFPNPFSSATNIVVNGISEKYDFELFDVTGRMERRISSIQTSQFELRRDDLSSGVYFYRLSVNAKQAAYGKLVVE